MVMETLYNEIIIDAPIGKVWEALSNIEELEQYDPTVKRSRALSPAGSGIPAIRKVDMKDGKNWFEEEVTVWKQNESLTYEFTDCSFPVQQLKHSYRLEQIGHQTKLKQVMK